TPRGPRSTKRRRLSASIGARPAPKSATGLPFRVRMRRVCATRTLLSEVYRGWSRKYTTVRGPPATAFGNPRRASRPTVFGATLSSLHMSHRNARLLAVAVFLIAPVACRPSADADPRMISEWERALYGVVRAERLSPPVASRVFTYAAAGLYS